MESPFKFLGHDNEGSLWVAQIPLPDDGTPGSGQFLEITLQTDNHEEFQITLTRRADQCRQHIASTTSSSTDAIANVLYGVARRRVIQIFEGIP